MAPNKVQNWPQKGDKKSPEKAPKRAPKKPRGRVILFYIPPRNNAARAPRRGERSDVRGRAAMPPRARSASSPLMPFFSKEQTTPERRSLFERIRSHIDQKGVTSQAANPLGRSAAKSPLSTSRPKSIHHTHAEVTSRTPKTTQECTRQKSAESGAEKHRTARTGTLLAV